MQRDTRHYAKRQITWFRADSEVIWISHLDMDNVRRQIESFLSH
jgi:tRNA dimethylallyltransferase